MSHKIAQLLLDFPNIASMCGGEQAGLRPLDSATVPITTKAYLAEIRQRLDEAASIAKAAQHAPMPAIPSRESRSRLMSSN